MYESKMKLERKFNTKKTSGNFIFHPLAKIVYLNKFLEIEWK